MNLEKAFDDDVVRIADLLEQVRALDNMISLHQQSGSRLMQEQYVAMQREFLLELRQLLRPFHLQAELESTTT